jgi:protein-S-isoprenylcysteine O-methyltransferase Ste14
VQVTLAVLVVAFAVLWGANFAAAGVRRDALYTAREGALVAGIRTVFILAALVALVLHATTPATMSWAEVELPAALRWTGAGVAALALLLLAWVLRTLGKNFSTTLTVTDEQTLVTAGPYRFVRHPMYTTFALLWLGFALLAQSWVVALAAAVGYGVVVALRTPAEERMLSERFGDEYRAYMRRTGRYLPRLR